jgi:putative hemolysin
MHLWLVLIALLLAGCAGTSPSQGTPRPAAQLANPASRHCVEQGGTLMIERNPAGDQYGVCVFTDNYQCEEWALRRGECRAGGIRVTGYATPAARYCAITGGRYAVTERSGAPDERGTCALPSGTTCEAEAYFRGTCRRGS